MTQNNKITIEEFNLFSDVRNNSRIKPLILRRTLKFNNHQKIETFKLYLCSSNKLNNYYQNKQFIGMLEDNINKLKRLIR